ncbi:MAG: PilZ domain-containing protein [Myxococcota bacterium]
MSSSPHRFLLSHAPPEAYAPMTRAILAKLGYAILVPEEFERVAGEADVRPVLRIVDERQLAEVPDESDPLPIIVLAGRHGVTGADGRIVGAIKRPAGMHELYRLIQQVTEETPRSTPRVATHLSARCRKDGREWSATVLSLSENGCLIRSPEPLLLGTRVDLEFALPREGGLQLEAEMAYQLLPDVGLIFHGIPTTQRQAIGRFVMGALVGGEAAAAS